MIIMLFIVVLKCLDHLMCSHMLYHRSCAQVDTQAKKSFKCNERIGGIYRYNKTSYLKEIWRNTAIVGMKQVVHR